MMWELPVLSDVLLLSANVLLIVLGGSFLLAALNDVRTESFKH